MKITVRLSGSSSLSCLIAMGALLWLAPILTAQDQVKWQVQEADFQSFAPVLVGSSGTFWTLKGPDGRGSPPYPFFPDELVWLNLPVCNLGGTHWLIDDRQVDYAVLREQQQLLRAAAQDLLADAPVPWPGDGGGSGGGGAGETNTWIGHLLTTNDLYLTFTRLGAGLAEMQVHAPAPDSYDLFEAATLDRLRTPSSWLWIQRTALEETNLAVALPSADSGFFVLGFTNSTAGDGLSDSWKLLSGLDTNVFYDATIRFKVLFPQNDTSVGAVTGTIHVLSGFPSWMAVLVDPTTPDALDNAVWMPIATNFPILLTNEGPHTVFVGLAGPLPTVAAAWHSLPLVYDQTPPLITLSSPATNSVPFPLIQLEGFCDEPLADLHFSLSNSLRQVSHVRGFVKAQHYDPQLRRMTTNHWQCYDLGLDTNGGNNTIVVTATDLAGNRAQAACNFTFSTNDLPLLPEVSVLYPQDGMRLCGSNLTLRGWLQDPTAKVTASLVNANGTNVVKPGIIERSGQFWVEQLPLTTGGTNQIVLTVTDIVGHSRTTNISFTTSDLTLTVDSVPPNQLHLPTAMVTGTVPDDSYSVWVNGVPAQVQPGGAWAAAGVPVEDGGTASFYVRAYPAGEWPEAAAGAGAAMTNPPSALASDIAIVQDKPLQVRVRTYAAHWEMKNDHAPVPEPTKREYDLNWKHLAASSAYDIEEYTNHTCRTDYSWLPDVLILHEQDPTLSGFQTNDCAQIETMVDPPQVFLEHCEVAVTRLSTNYGVVNLNSYQRQAQTVLELITGGKALSHSESQYHVTASATQVTNLRWPVEGACTGTPLPAPGLVVGSLGALSNEGVLDVALPDNSTHNVTVSLPPTTPPTPFYTFDVTVSRLSDP